MLLHATRQFANGSVNHWWHALADFGNRTACRDVTSNSNCQGVTIDAATNRIVSGYR